LVIQEIARGDVMPVVIVEMWQGRTEEQKAKLIKGITKAFEDIGVPADRLHIIIHDVPKCNWGTGGEPASKMNP
jgi:4-oxalocrotonate tautomerase